MRKEKKKNFFGMKKICFVFCFALLAMVAKSSLFPPHLNIGTMNKTTGVRFLGISSGFLTGNSVSGAGDVDGDKVKDFLIGAPATTSLQGGATNAGQVYVCMDNRTQQQQWEFGDQISTSPHLFQIPSLVVSSTVLRSTFPSFERIQGIFQSSIIRGHQESSVLI